MEDEWIQPGIRKCMNTKAQHDEVMRHWLRSDKPKVWNEPEATKARETRTVRSE